MKTALAVSLFLVPALALAENADPQVAQALKKLEAARSASAAAVKKIEVDPPATADIDAASKAVDELKVAIDASAPFEAKDLDLAKGVLAARKEMRTQRDYVDQRRANIKVHEARRNIDGALGTLSETGRRISASGASAKDFEDAHAAANVVKKLVDENKQYGKQEPKFAAFITEVEATLAKHNKTIDERGLKILVEKARTELQAAFKAFTDANGALTAQSTDAQFKAADDESKDLAKVLESGKDLEPKDKQYGAEAEKARNALNAGKKKADDLWSQSGVERLKNEIEPARKDLLAALKNLRGKPNADQLAEAKTVSIVVQKLVEKFAPEAQRSKAFGDYVAGVKKDLVEVQVVLQRGALTNAQSDARNALRNADKKGSTKEQIDELTTALTVLEKTIEATPKSPDIAAQVQDAKTFVKDARTAMGKRFIDNAKADANTALRAVDKKGATDAQFKELETALTVLEKTLEQTPKDPSLSATVSDAKTFIKDARGTVAKRKIDNVKADAQTALRAVDKKGAPEEAFKELETALTVLEKTVEQMPKDPAVAATVSDARTFVKDARATIARRRQESDVGEQKGKVEEAKKKANEAMKEIQAQKVTPEQFKAAEDAVKGIADALEAGKELRKKDGDYARYESDTKKRIAELNERIVARKKQQAAADVRATLQAAVQDTATKIDTALAAPGTDADLDAATNAFEELGKMIDGQQNLERTDQSYAAAADRARNQTFKLLDKLQLAQMARELRRGTGDALADGDKAAKAADAANDLKAKKKANDQAASYYRSCEKDGRIILSRYQQAKLETKVQVLLDGQPAAPSAVIAACTSRAEKAEAASKETVPLIAFDDGPKKAFEAAKNFMSKGDKKEALAQYNECVTTGVILGNRAPELKERKMAVAGTNLTLAEVIAQCQADRKSLGGK